MNDVMFHNGDLSIDLERIMNIEEPTIRVAETDDDNDSYPYILDVADSCYFYANKEDGISDSMKIAVLLLSKQDRVEYSVGTIIKTSANLSIEIDKGTISIDRSSYIFKMISYHLSSICNEILNQDDDIAESSGTIHIKQELEHQYLMGSFEAILERLDILAIELYNAISKEVLEGYEEMLYDYVYSEFILSYE